MVNEPEVLCFVQYSQRINLTLLRFFAHIDPQTVSTLAHAIVELSVSLVPE